jgi:hypothetical protein
VLIGGGTVACPSEYPDGETLWLAQAAAGPVQADGTSEEIRGQAGQVLAMPATTHLPENLSDQPFEIILVELKA